jgi:hypothetical protein
MGTKCESKRSVMVSICPYFEIHKEIIRNLESEHYTFFFFKKESSSTSDFIRKVQPLHYPKVKKDQCRGITVALIQIFGVGFKHIKVNVQNLIFLFF